MLLRLPESGKLKIYENIANRQPNLNHGVEKKQVVERMFVVLTSQGAMSWSTCDVCSVF